jgi:hypothetical protein
VANFQVDYMEACTLALVRTNHACPTCVATKTDFHSIRKQHPARTVDSMRALYNEANEMQAYDPQGAEMLMKDKGLVNEKVCSCCQLTNVPVLYA